MFTVPPSKASEPQNRYQFQVDGKSYDCPKLGYVSGEVLEELVFSSRLGDLAFTVASFDLFGTQDTEAGRAVRSLDEDQFKALRADYFRASGITLGESSASTDS